MPRVLYLPSYSSPRNLATCTIMSWARIFFPRILEANEDLFLYFGLPDGVDYHEPWMDDPRVEIWRGAPNEEDQVTMFSLIDDVFLERFREFDGPNPVDIVLMDKAVPLPMMRALSEVVNLPSRRVYACNMPFDFVPSQNKLSENHFALQSLGLCQADVVAALSPGYAKRMRKTARKYVPAHMSARLLENIHVGCGYFDVELFKEKYKEGSKPSTPPFVFNWGTGFNSVYKVDNCMQALKKVMALGKHDIRLMITSSSQTSGQHQNQIDDVSWQVTENWRLPRPKFYERLNQCHISIYWAWRDTFSGSQLEQAAFGLLGIYNERFPPPWVPKNYPFLFKGDSDLPTVIMDAMDRYNDPVIRKMVKDIQENILENYSGQNDADQLWGKCTDALVKKKDYKEWCRRAKWLLKMVDQLVPPYDEVTLEQMVHRVRDLGTKGILVGERKGYKGTWVGCDDLRDAMICCGWQDTYSTSSPTFVFKPETRIAPSNEWFEKRRDLSASRGGKSSE